jgi:hypothetical protein
MSSPIDLNMLRSYLAEDLSAEDMARVEKALRSSSELRAQLEDARSNRSDAGLHTLGAIWRRGRLTCPSREQLGTYLLDALDSDLAAYITFHVDVVECPICQANLADLRGKASKATVSSQSSRHKRIFDSSIQLLPGDRKPAK